MNSMNSTIKVKVVVFDLDGTLINTAPDVRNALNYMLTQYRLPTIHKNEIYELIGLGALVMIQNAFAKFNYQLSPADLNQAHTYYLDYYRQHPAIESYVYPGVKSVLDQLKNQGIRFGICTNKPNVMTHLVLEQFQLKDYFTAIVAGDDIPHAKPHGQHILDVLHKMNCHENHAVMVGDSDVDKTSAINAGIQFIGVTYGYNRTPIVTDILIDHFEELPKIIYPGK